MVKVNIGPLEDEKGDIITGNEKMAEVFCVGLHSGKHK